MPLVITSLSGRQTDTDTHTHTLRTGSILETRHVPGLIRIWKMK